MKPTDSKFISMQDLNSTNKVPPFGAPSRNCKKRRLNHDSEYQENWEISSVMGSSDRNIVAKKRFGTCTGLNSPGNMPGFHLINSTLSDYITAKTVDKNENILPQTSIVNSRVYTSNSREEEKISSDLVSGIRKNFQEIANAIEEEYKIYEHEKFQHTTLNDGYEFYNIPTVYLQCDQDIVDVHGWRYIRTLGEGSYGKVYLVRSEYTGEECAFKRMMLDEVLGLTPTILREIYALTVLKHKNIIPLDKVYLGNCRIYLSFPKINGGNIRQYIERYHPNGLSMAKVKEVSRQLIDALAYCHSKQIMHRDIKPENILCILSGGCNNTNIESLKRMSIELYNRLSGNDLTIPHQRSIANKVCTIPDLEQVVISDFGLSRIQKPLDIPHGRNPIINSPLSPEVVTLCYRPPELLLGDYYYSYPVDIWSLGCVIMEMILGRPLFDNSSELSLLLSIFKKFGKPRIDDWPEVASLPFMVPLDILYFIRIHSIIQQSFELPEINGCPDPFATLKENGKIVDDACIDLLSKMLTLNPNKRITAEEALMHEWFKA